MALAGAFFFGFVPMLLLAAFVNWLDRYEKEPILLLGGVFLWGAVVAAGSAFLYLGRGEVHPLLAGSAVLGVLVENFDIKPVAATAAEDLKTILS